MERACCPICSDASEGCLVVHSDECPIEEILKQMEEDEEN